MSVRYSMKAKLENTIKKILRENKIKPKQVGLIGREGQPSDVATNKAIVEIMKAANISYGLADAAMYGIKPPYNGADHEMSSTGYNFCNYYNGAKLKYVIMFVTDIAKGVKYWEVGLKYPQFRKDYLIRKYKLNLITTVLAYPEMNMPDHLKTYYEVWQDTAKEYTFTFEKDRMGTGGYAGLVVDSIDKVYWFVQWFLSKKSFYVKDVDLYYNRLGGFGIDKLKELKLL